MIEHFFQCPYCWQNISMLLEPGITQSYIEDCEVCCQPIRIKVEFDNGQLINFSSDSIEQ
ncbi:MAG: CPXCG motif-containing cysteine-rich protein [Psychroflexus sp.]|uniref:CPXCG motif-containing cysteine-rich protein n=1 Tax=Psychroflexus sp. S27 TaxID=1982757 RepID=UPI000C298249|nr:CPXCG motif-containing cysteine-rich protein [Psychroflexus sp. S27]PJX21917.1 CPXCG motif-containing cysteine-rich protein [Psychroflexus sp. S27]